MDVLVFGSAIVDFICYVQRLPKAGETLHGTAFTTGYGGKGANQCVAAARMGAKVALIAKVGDDQWGVNYTKHLEGEGINIENMEICEGASTGIAQICVAASGENHIVIVTGANALLSVDDVMKSQKMFDEAKILICQLETPLEATLSALQSFKGTTILNAAPATKDLPMELLQAATILCVNEIEAETMTATPKIESIEQSKVALKALIEMGINIAIITLGELGAIYSTRDDPQSFIHVPTMEVDNVVDTTGAGDAFIGSLAYYLVRFPYLPLHNLVGAACEIASKSVQSRGTQSSFVFTTQLGTQIDEREFVRHSV